MKKGSYVFAVTAADLARVYGENRQLRELVRKLERSPSIEESLNLLLRFDDANWMQWASPTLAPVLQDAGTAQARPGGGSANGRPAIMRLEV